MDLYNELMLKQQQLDYSLKQMPILAKKYAEAYTNYRIELAKELTRLKNDGMAVTIAYDIARGKPEVAKLKFEEIANEGLYNACKESINVKKLEIKILQEQINKEYSNISE